MSNSSHGAQLCHFWVTEKQILPAAGSTGYNSVADVVVGAQPGFFLSVKLLCVLNPSNTWKEQSQPGTCGGDGKAGASPWFPNRNFFPAFPTGIFFPLAEWGWISWSCFLEPAGSAACCGGRSAAPTKPSDCSAPAFLGEISCWEQPKKFHGAHSQIGLGINLSLSVCAGYKTFYVLVPPRSSAVLGADFQ